MIPKFTVFQADTPYGPMLLTDVTDKYAERMAKLYEEEQYEPTIKKAVETLDYDVFLDVGAAFGYFSLVAAARTDVRKVYAYEPHPIRYGLLWRNVAKIDKIHPSMRFVGSAQAAATVFASNAPGGLFGRERPDGKGRHKEAAPISSRSLDEIVAQELPNQALKVCTKLDVEGFELDVLAGAKTLLNSPNSTFIIEIHKTYLDVQEVLQYTASYGFKAETILDNAKNRTVVLQREAL